MDTVAETVPVSNFSSLVRNQTKPTDVCRFSVAAVNHLFSSVWTRRRVFTQVWRIGGDMASRPLACVMSQCKYLFPARVCQSLKALNKLSDV